MAAWTGGERGAQRSDGVTRSGIGWHMVRCVNLQPFIKTTARFSLVLERSLGVLDGRRPDVMENSRATT